MPFIRPYCSVISISLCLFGLLSSGFAQGETPDAAPIVEAPAPEHSKDMPAEKPASAGLRADEGGVQMLPEVNVQGLRIVDAPFHATQPISSVTAEELSRGQPSNIFEAVRSIPGVSVTGGPRPSGMTFSIRGYADNEDVMVKVDGVPKGFEKYRMGGTFVEPELLKSIEVQRGPQITSGSGSLGGTIIATTKNAEDFLRPGQQFGGKAKFGYGNNSDEYSRSYLIYARPDERVDLLYNYANRQSNNITLPDGTALANSAIQSVSHLLKVSLFPTEDIELVTSVVKFEDTGLQAYDATGGQPGLFGNVVRTIDDLTWSETIHYDPVHPWLDLKAAIGAGHTHLNDVITQDMGSVFNPRQTACDGLTYLPDPANTTTCRGNLTDIYEYKTRTLDISNRAVFAENGWFNASLLLGYQYNESAREIGRYYDNPNSATQTSQYPNGFNASAPPGTKSFNAWYLQPRFEFGALSLTPGYRVDNYAVEAEGGTLQRLKLFEEKSKLSFKEETVSLGLAYDLLAKTAPEKLTLYSNYGQGFRPPLIDEYFTQGTFSRCRVAATVTPGLTMTNGPASGICGALYKPQRAESTEVGVSYQTPHFLGSAVWLSSKLNFFHIYTSDLLLSLRQQPDGSISQDGWERRNGVEFETVMRFQKAYLRGAYSRTRGELFDGGQQVQLYTVPGNTLNLNLGAELTQAIEVNLTYRKVSERAVVVGGGGTQALQFGEQDGYELWNAGIRWKANDQLTLRLIGENLKNEAYRVDGHMGGLGIFAPGRNVKFFVELSY